MFRNVFFVFTALFLALSANQAMAADCTVGTVTGKSLNEEFGDGTEDLTSCINNKSDVRIVVQINKSCRDSYATHPVGANGKPNGESRIVNSVSRCAGSDSAGPTDPVDFGRSYALGNIKNLLNDLITTNGVAPENIHIKAIVHSGGGYLLLKDTGNNGNGDLLFNRNKFQNEVENLMTRGVEFYFCQNTTRGFIRNGTLPAGDATAQLIPGVKYVTAGVTAISDLQDQGYMYVQP